MSPISKTSLFAAVLAMASTSAAHMTMKTPTAFAPKPNNSPLEPDGSDFPCKAGAGGAYARSSSDQWKVGSQVTLTFDQGTATHGGGSCQVSVTKDKVPTKDSVWKVVHSIEGDCPATGAGNGGTLNEFPFTVPEELPEGELTMAWTWFNKIGNREMYMNCGPISVSGGSGDGFDDLPDMAVANIAGQGSCATTEGMDYTFENPGKSVARSANGNFGGLCGGAASEGGSSTPSKPAPKPDTPKPETPSYDTGAAPQAPEASTPMPSTPMPEAPSAPSGGSSGGSSCSEEGALMCGDGGKTFGLCSNGMVSYMPVAAGTTCAGGAITRRSYIHRNQRRHI